MKSFVPALAAFFLAGCAAERYTFLPGEGVVVMPSGKKIVEGSKVRFVKAPGAETFNRMTEGQRRDEIQRLAKEYIKNRGEITEMNEKEAEEELEKEAEMLLELLGAKFLKVLFIGEAKASLYHYKSAKYHSHKKVVVPSTTFVMQLDCEDCPEGFDDDFLLQYRLSVAQALLISPERIFTPEGIDEECQVPTRITGSDSLELVEDLEEQVTDADSLWSQTLTATECCEGQTCEVLDIED